VGIYNSSGTLLVSGTVTPESPLTSYFLYVSVAPIVLPVGNGYVIAAATGSDQYTPFTSVGPAFTTIGGLQVCWGRFD
jgi:hypothetical protein